MDPSLLGRPIPAPTAQKPTGLITKRTFLIIVGLIAALVGGGFLLLASSDNSDNLLQTLSARHATTQRLVADGQKNITDDNLKKLNSELSIVLMGDSAALQAEVKKAGIKKTDKLIVAAEADSATFDTLTSAKLNATYDSTYRRVIAQKLESLLALIQELHDETKSKSLKAVLAAQYERLAIYSKSLETLDT